MDRPFPPAWIEATPVIMSYSPPLEGPLSTQLLFRGWLESLSQEEGNFQNQYPLPLHKQKPPPLFPVQSSRPPGTLQTFSAQGPAYCT